MRVRLRRTLLVWLVGGWIANFVWEVAQRPLYAGYRGFVSHLSDCLRASAIDVAIGAGLYALMALATRELDWSLRFSWPRAILLAGAGLAVAVVLERRALASGKWAYAPSMPLVPWLDLGWSPLVQMMLIPIGLALVSGPWHGGRAARARG